VPAKEIIDHPDADALSPSAVLGLPAARFERDPRRVVLYDGAADEQPKESRVSQDMRAYKSQKGHPALAKESPHQKSNADDPRESIDRRRQEADPRRRGPELEPLGGEAQNKHC
jgi:hypothetical protein